MKIISIEKRQQIVQEIKDLENGLKQLKQLHISSWDMFGSELYVEEFFRSEKNLEDKIVSLIEQLNTV